VLTAAYLINRTPTKVLRGKTPYEIIFDCKHPMMKFAFLVLYAMHGTTHE